jgi:hypothetical protein
MEPQLFDHDNAKTEPLVQNWTFRKYTPWAKTDANLIPTKQQITSKKQGLVIIAL